MRLEMFVPVVDKNNSHLMPTTCSRAYRWIKSRKATPFWKKGIFCVRLNLKPSNDNKQEIACGIDPGIKREAYTIKSESHTYLNILTETPDWVKKNVETRSVMRRNRRKRKTRYREKRSNNRRNAGLPPSIKSRWQLKLRICQQLRKIIPITHYVVEDVKANPIRCAKKWNKSFSPLEVGKNWFYTELKKMGELYIKRGYETKELRNDLGLKKNSKKLKDSFDCHNVDSWVLANWLVGGHLNPDNKEIIKFIPMRFFRRQLHFLQFAKGGTRKRHGGTRSMGFKRGSLVKTKKYGFGYVGGTRDGRISIHSIETGKRISVYTKIENCKFKTYLSYRRASLSKK